MSPQQTGNPVADELLGLSPEAKSALITGVGNHINGSIPNPPAAPLVPSSGVIPNSPASLGQVADNGNQAGTLLANAMPTRLPPSAPATPGPEFQTAGQADSSEAAADMLGKTSAPPSQGPVPGAIPIAPKPAGPAATVMNRDAALPDGLINRTGGDVNGTPSVPRDWVNAKPAVPGAISNSGPLRQRANTLAASPSGIDAIHNPWARVPLQVLDSIGTMFAPRIAAAIPGTELHHERLLGQAENAAKGEEEGTEAAARAGQQEAQTTEAQERTKHLGDQPPPTITTDKGIMQWNPETHAYDKNVGNAAPKEEQEGKTVTTKDGLFQWNPFTKKYDTKVGDAPEKDTGTITHFFDKEGNAWVLNHDGTAKPVTGPGGAQIQGGKEEPTKSEIRNVMVNGKPHQVMFDEKGNQVKDLGETGEKPPTVNVNGETSQLDREATHYGTGHQKAVDAANAQLEKIGEARALLTTGNAESQALAVPKVMTALISGQGSGVRITQPELNAIGNARGITGDVQAWIQKMGSGKKLTPQQSQQLVGVLDAASERLQEKRQIANDALSGINGATKREEMIAIDKAARDKLAAMETGGKQATVMVQIPGHEPAPIDADKLGAFQKKYPQAKVVNAPAK